MEEDPAGMLKRIEEETEQVGEAELIEILEDVQE